MRNDFYRVREACLAAERRYGLRSTAPADRTSARRPSRAEAEKAARHGRGEPVRVTLRRQVTTAAAASGSQEEFFARLDQAGVLVRQRFSMRNPSQVTGYAVALSGDTAAGGGPVWYGGGKLAPDLTWPKLCQRWTPHPNTSGADRLTAAERNAVWEHAAQAATDAAGQIRALAGTDPAAAADAAWAASGTLHVAAAMLGSRTLRQAADAYDRAARVPHGRIPPPTPAGNRMRQAARLISAFTYLTGDPVLSAIVLITRLAALAEAVAELRAAQHHAAQAAAARAAAERLYASTHPAERAQPRRAARARTAAQLAALGFPPTVPGGQPPTPDHPSHRQGGPPSGRRPSAPRSRSPGR